MSGRPAYRDETISGTAALRECAVRLRVQSSHASVRSLKVFFPVAVFFIVLVAEPFEKYERHAKEEAPPNRGTRER